MYRPSRLAASALLFVQLCSLNLYAIGPQASAQLAQAQKDASRSSGNNEVALTESVDSQELGAQKWLRREGGAQLEIEIWQDGKNNWKAMLPIDFNSDLASQGLVDVVKNLRDLDPQRLADFVGDLQDLDPQRLADVVEDLQDVSDQELAKLSEGTVEIKLALWQNGKNVWQVTLPMEFDVNRLLQQVTKEGGELEKMLALSAWFQQEKTDEKLHSEECVEDSKSCLQVSLKRKAERLAQVAPMAAALWLSNLPTMVKANDNTAQEICIDIGLGLSVIGLMGAFIKFVEIYHGMPWLRRHHIRLFSRIAAPLAVVGYFIASPPEGELFVRYMMTCAIAVIISVFFCATKRNGETLDWSWNHLPADN